MNKSIIIYLFFVVTVAVNSVSFATITKVSGDKSSIGDGDRNGDEPKIIDAPVDVGNDGRIGKGQLGFDEAQGVITSQPYRMDDNPESLLTLIELPVGSVVDSHMIFLNKETGTGLSIAHHDVVWTFSKRILGVMSDRWGEYEVASTPELGAPGTIYPTSPFEGRGMEILPDYYTVLPDNDKQLKVDMGAGQPGDWARVITGNCPPVLDPIPPFPPLDEETLLTILFTAKNPDDDTLTFSLDPGAPTGASIDPVTGVFTWTPTEAQGPGSYSVTVRVTDDGTPSLDDSQEVPIEVREVNSKPVTEQIRDIIDAVQKLKDSGILNNGEANPLLNFLNQAIRDLTDGRTEQAIKKLENFIGRIQKLLNDGTLTLKQGQPLIDAANAVIEEISS